MLFGFRFGSAAVVNRMAGLTGVGLVGFLDGLLKDLKRLHLGVILWSLALWARVSPIFRLAHS